MNTNAIVSIVMGVFNGEKYLLHSINSILTQSFRDFEFIVIDDASKDSTFELLKSIDDPRLKVIRNDRNLGLTCSLNIGIRASCGQYIARMDHDDISHPDRLALQIAFLDSHEDYGMVGSSGKSIDSDGNTQGLLVMPCTHEAIESTLEKVNCFIHPSVMVRREVFDDVGLYDEFLRYAQDFDLWLRIVEHYKVANLPQELIYYRTHSEQISANRIRAQTICAHQAISKSKYRRSIKSGDWSFRFHLIHLWKELRGKSGTLGSIYYSNAERYYSIGDSKSTFKMIFFSITNSPLWLKPLKLLLKCGMKLNIKFGGF